MNLNPKEKLFELADRPVGQRASTTVSALVHRICGGEGADSLCLMLRGRE